MPFVIYSVLRLALLALVGVLLFLVGLRGWPLVVIATLLALMVSYVALVRPREGAAVYLAERRERRTAERSSGKRARISQTADADADAEDAHVDGALGPRPARPGTAGAPRSSQPSDREPEAQ